MCTDGVHCRESACTGPVVLKIVPVTCAAFSGFTIDQVMCASIFPHTRYWYEVVIYDTEKIGDGYWYLIF